MTQPDPAPSRIPNLRAILFDLDGTLIDTIDMIRASMRHATAVVLGESLPDEVLMRNVGIPLAQQMREFSPEHAEELLGVYREHNHEIHDEMLREYPGVEEALVALREQGYALGIVTSKSRPVAFRGLERFGLEGYFDVAVCCEDVSVHKPAPDPLLAAAEQMGVGISECAYVGDSPHDMTAAVSAGCVSIAATWGGFSRQTVLEPGPDYAADSMTDVVSILSGNESAFRTRE